MLPPYGKQYLDRKPSAGIWVAIGPGAWDFAKKKSFPVMVLPEEKHPSDFEWPTNYGPVLIIECGPFNDERLEEMAFELLKVGATSACVIRLIAVEALNDEPELESNFAAGGTVLWYEPEVQSDAA